MSLSVRTLYDRVQVVDDVPTTSALASPGALTQIIVDLLPQFQASISFLGLAHVPSRQEHVELVVSAPWS